MADKQLELVAEWERDKEQKLARDFQIAQQHADHNNQKLASLEQYKQDYLLQTQQQSSSGVSGQKLIQLQLFIGKLDRACQQQTTVVQQSNQVALQRKQIWVTQQSKRKAVELLIEKRRAKAAVTEERREQALSDELSNMRFLRQKQRHSA